MENLQIIVYPKYIVRECKNLVLSTGLNKVLEHFTESSQKTYFLGYEWEHIKRNEFVQSLLYTLYKEVSFINIELYSKYCSIVDYFFKKVYETVDEKKQFKNIKDHYNKSYLLKKKKAYKTRLAFNELIQSYKKFLTKCNMVKQIKNIESTQELLKYDKQKILKSFKEVSLELCLYMDACLKTIN